MASTTMATAPADEQQTVDFRGEHFGAVEAVGVTFGGRPLRERQRTQRQDQRQHVGGEVRRVGDQREAPEDEAADDLDQRGMPRSRQVRSVATGGELGTRCR